MNSGAPLKSEVIVRTGLRPSPAGAIPIAFGPEGGRCFGWFHPAASSTRGVGIVLCKPVGYEGNCAYETFTELAERLASVGFPVIRFDYQGTGDSSGSDADPDRVRAWQGSVSSAIDEVQSLGGVSRVGLFGIRIGATLAAHAAAAKGGVESLALWAPCVSGRHFARELKMSSQVAAPNREPSFAGLAEGDIEALGYLYTGATLRDLSTLDLMKLRPWPSRAVLFVGRDDMPGEGPLPGALRSAGVQVTHRDLPGYAFMMVEPHEGEVAVSTLEAIVDWYCSVHPVEAEASPSRPLMLPEQRESIFDGVRETPLLFGSEQNLFGILSEPAETLPGDDPRSRVALLMLNVGTNHRVGPNRMYVKMARSWAARGYRSLRFDLAGIGDSRTAAGYSATRLYSRGSTVDVQAAMDALGALGCDQFVLVGLCSGAYVAFQTARADTRVAGQILMNPRRLAWRDGDTLESVMKQSYKSTHFYRRALFEPKTYVRLLRGEIDARGIMRRVGSLAVARLRRAAQQLRGSAPTEEEVLANMRQLCHRGTSMLLIVGAEDDGLDYLEFHLGTRGQNMRGAPNFSMVFVEGTDHTFSNGDSQAFVIKTVIDHLDSRFAALRGRRLSP